MSWFKKKRRSADWRGKKERRFRWGTFRFEWGRWCYTTNFMGETTDYWWEWE